jgi:hypothetical protein
MKTLQHNVVHAIAEKIAEHYSSGNTGPTVIYLCGQCDTFIALRYSDPATDFPGTFGDAELAWKINQHDNETHSPCS